MSKNISRTLIMRPGIWKEQNLSQIARLIYLTDPYIYPHWFGDEAQAIRPLTQLFNTCGSAFHEYNFYTADDLVSDNTVGIIVALSSRSNLDFDYESYKTNDNARFTIEHYVEPLIREVKQSDDGVVHIMNFCIAPGFRGHGAGQLFLTETLRMLKGYGFKQVRLDCLQKNIAALNLYHKLGFQDVSTGIGFDGTDTSTIPTVHLQRYL